MNKVDRIVLNSVVWCFAAVGSMFMARAPDLHDYSMATFGGLMFGASAVLSIVITSTNDKP